MGRIIIPRKFYDFSWSTKNADAPWTPRDGPIVTFYNDKYWLLGGWHPDIHGAGIDSTNEIWSSDDLITWTEEQAYDPAPTTRWKRRHWFGCEQYTEAGTDYLYVLGGDHESAGDPDFASTGGYQNDIWRTTTPGGVWTRVMSSDDAPWAGRMLQVWGNSGDALWMFGGQDGVLGELTSTLHNDLWTSTDGGFTWSEVFADAAPSSSRPSARGIINRMPLWNGRMWLVGGGTYDTVDHPDRLYRREVWSFDPANAAAGFTQHHTPPWMGTEYNSVQLFTNRLFLLGGYSLGVNTRTVWSTADGERWTRHETPPWGSSHADGTCVVGRTLAHVGGNNDIGVDNATSYALAATVHAPVSVTAPRATWDVADAVLSGSDIVSIPDGTGNGHHLVPSVLGDATYNASDDDYGGAPSAESDGGLFLHSTNAIDMSAFTIFLVAYPDTADGLYYLTYANTASQPYAYTAVDRTGAPEHFTTMQAVVRRSGISAIGTATGVVLNQKDTAHIFTFHYDGTTAGTFARIDGAVSIPWEVANVSDPPGVDPGTAAWSEPLYFLSDLDGLGSKAGTMAAARVYPPLTLPEIQAVERELRSLYPYKFPA